jgi:membrane fusion protein (multidrug efflux system)
MGLGLLAVFTLGACHRKESGHHEVLMLTHPLQQDTTITREYTGQIKSCKNFKVIAADHGYLETSHLKEGQQVKAGDVMFKIMPGGYKTALNRAESEAEVAKTAFEAMERRQKKQEASDNDVARAKAQWDDKLAQVKVAQSDEGLSMIKAPFSGMVGRLTLPEGSLVSKGTLLTTLTDNSEMWVYFNVREPESREYAAQGQPEENKQVALVLANGKTFDQPGRVNGTEAKLDADDGPTTFRAVFPNPTGVLRNGASGIIRMRKTIKQAVLVPQSATIEKRDHHYVFVVGKDHVMKQRQVTISAEVGDLFVVSDGVGVGDTIIFAGLGQAKDGAKAEGGEFEEPEKAFAHLKQ